MPRLVTALEIDHLQPSVPQNGSGLGMETFVIRTAVGEGRRHGADPR